MEPSKEHIDDDESDSDESVSFIEKVIKKSPSANSSIDESNITFRDNSDTSHIEDLAKEPAEEIPSHPAPHSRSSHPPTSQMVKSALKFLNNGKGTSIQAIGKYIFNNYVTDLKRQNFYTKKYLKKAVEEGVIIQVKGKGAIGTFKLANAKEAKGKKLKSAIRVKRKNTVEKKQSENKTTSESKKKKLETKSPESDSKKKKTVESKTKPKTAAKKKVTEADSNAKTTESKKQASKAASHLTTKENVSEPEKKSKTNKKKIVNKTKPEVKSKMSKKTVEENKTEAKAKVVKKVTSKAASKNKKIVAEE